MEDYQFWIILGITTVGVYFTREQVRLIRAQMAAKKSAKNAPAWKVYSPAGLILLLTLVNWGPYLSSYLRSKNPEPLAERYVTSWGVLPSEARQGNLRLTANGHGLLPFRKSWKIAAVCFHYNGTRDISDVEDLQKSALYDIRDGDILIVIPADAKFRKEVEAGQAGTNYYLLLVPPSVKMEQFGTLRQAESLGVRSIWTGSGPP